jgi:hypothetical protein
LKFAVAQLVARGSRDQSGSLKEFHGSSKGNSKDNHIERHVHIHLKTDLKVLYAASIIPSDIVVIDALQPNLWPLPASARQ